MWRRIDHQNIFQSAGRCLSVGILLVFLFGCGRNFGCGKGAVEEKAASENQSLEEQTKQKDAAAKIKKSGKETEERPGEIEAQKESGDPLATSGFQGMEANTFADLKKKVQSGEVDISELTETESRLTPDQEDEIHRLLAEKYPPVTTDESDDLVTDQEGSLQKEGSDSLEVAEPKSISEDGFADLKEKIQSGEVEYSKLTETTDHLTPDQEDEIHRLLAEKNPPAEKTSGDKEGLTKTENPRLGKDLADIVQMVSKEPLSEESLQRILKQFNYDDLTTEEAEATAADSVIDYLIINKKAESYANKPGIAEKIKGLPPDSPERERILRSALFDDQLTDVGKVKDKEAKEYMAKNSDKYPSSKSDTVDEADLEDAKLRILSERFKASNNQYLLDLMKEKQEQPDPRSKMPSNR